MTSLDVRAVTANHANFEAPSTFDGRIEDDKLSFAPVVQPCLSAISGCALTYNMLLQSNSLSASCKNCQDRPSLDIAFSMAFQPIVDVRNRTVFAYEALVRGLDGSGAAQILGQVNDKNRYQFDQACRVKAVSLAARLGVNCHVSINFLPNAVYEPAARSPQPAARSLHPHHVGSGPPAPVSD